MFLIICFMSKSILQETFLVLIVFRMVSYGISYGIINYIPNRSKSQPFISGDIIPSIISLNFPNFSSRSGQYIYDFSGFFAKLLSKGL